jgi:RNA polymerase sigma-70 factor (ECF subfamily)
VAGRGATMEAVQAHPPDSPGEVAEGVLATTDFVDCYQAHYLRLVRALRLSGADASTAEDVAQEAFARALVHWRRVRKGANPPGYVYTTAFRLLQRAQRRHPPPGQLSPPSVSPAAVASPAAGPAPTEAAAVTAVAIEATLADMPPRRRACAVMCLVTGLPVHEAAAALGIADGTVRKHLDEARQDLRDAGVAER